MTKLVMTAGTEQWISFLKNALLRASRSEKAISIEVNDRSYAKWALAQIRKELGLVGKIAITLPAKPNEIWLKRINDG